VRLREGIREQGAEGPATWSPPSLPPPREGGDHVAADRGQIQGQGLKIAGGRRGWRARGAFAWGRSCQRLETMGRVEALALASDPAGQIGYKGAVRGEF
jgi:hypothetical protein